MAIRLNPGSIFGRILPVVVLAASFCFQRSLCAADEPAAAAAAPSPEAIERFEKQIRPLLVEHCQKCHGSKKQEGELRLDSRAALLKGGEHGPVVVPGAPAESRLITAIGYADKDLQMPPDEQLPAASVALVAEWVRQGAPWPETDSQAVDKSAAAAEAWKKHWAAQPVRPQPLPAVKDAPWVASPVDAFVLARLEQNGLKPSPPADRRTLLRRATFDLIGLPPTLAEIAAFEADTSPDAFAKVIERLLASPHYGERWGRHWLDVARYADTKEYVRLKEERRLLFAFTYRDYVTRSLNADLPYNQFVVEQLAADLLPAGDDRHALAALGFLTLGRQFTGNPHDIIDDRIDVTTRGLLGLTVTCARCHDHKFDPIPTADYYSLYGIFDSAEVPAVPPLVEPTPADPSVQAHQKEVEAAESALAKYQQQAHERLLHELRANVGAYLAAALEGRRRFLVPLPAAPGEVRHFVAERWLDCLEADERSHTPALVAWRALAAIGPKEDFAGRARQILAELRSRDGSDPAAPRANSLVLSALKGEQLASMSDVARVYGDLLRGVYLRFRGEREPINLIVNGSFEQDGPTTNHSPSGWQLAGGRFCVLSSEGATDGELAAVFGDGTTASQPPTAHTAAISQTVATRPGVRYRLSCDFAVYGNGAETNAQTLGVRVAGRQPLVEQAVSHSGSAPANFQGVKLDFVADGPAATVSFSDATANGESGLADGVLDNVCLVELSADGAPLVAPRSADSDDPERGDLLALLVDADSPTSVTHNDAVDFYLYDSPVHDRVMALRTGLNELLAKAPRAPARAHVVAERLAPYDPRIFLRGDPSRRGPAVPRRFLAALAGDDRKPLPAATARLELARAIASPTNPLTARVLVNRVWQHHFGTGLVSSPSNFGLRSDPPSHPELLDYLADRFVSEGWSIKQLHRWMMLSNTWQQSSADRPDAVPVDPENRLLSRMNRQRLDFESLRDAMLATAGRLDPALFGPPVDLAALDCRRRTLYGLVDRQNLSSMLRNFDFASPDAHTPTRHVTTVPQQALFLLNDPLVVEQAAALAERTSAAPGAADLPEQRIVRMFQLALGRQPSAEEMRSAKSFVAAGGSWPDFAQVMLLSNEIIFVD
jgi:mono/diheme cytochrome c family protein